MNYQELRLRERWQDYAKVVPAVYRSLAFILATVQISVFPAFYYSVITPIILITGVGIYTLIQVLYHLRLYQTGILGHSILGIDIAFCMFLITSTGGLYSPLLLYTLAPVLTAALFLDIKMTFFIGVLSGAYVIGSHVANPFFTSELSFPALSYFLLYVMSVWLATALPYITNVNLRQRRQVQNVLQERQRLSREIHDGVAQSTSALRWQLQMLERHLLQMGINLGEVRGLIRLAERAHQDARESMEVLRKYTGNGSFLPHLKDHLEHLKQDANIDFHFSIEGDKFHLETPVEIELLRICQEALNNVRMHSGAQDVQVKIKKAGTNLEVSIADNGCGFDSSVYQHGENQANRIGLEVMRERAESVGGRLSVLSLLGQGTEIRVEVPADSRRGRFLWLNR